MCIRDRFRVISSEHSHTPCVHISCDYCDSFEHDDSTCPLLSIPHRSEALVAFNRELCLHSLHKTNLSLGSSKPEAWSCDQFDVSCET